MRFSIGSTTAAAIAIALGLAPGDADAQWKRGRNGDDGRPKYTAEIYAGFANFGRFLEQHALIEGAFDLAFLGQRELTADNAFALGGSIGIWPLEKTSVRLGYTWAKSEFKYEDDTGLDFDILDRDDLADINVHVFSLELLQYFLPLTRRLNAYVLAGINGAFWVLGDETRIIIIADDDVLFRSDLPNGVAGDNQFRWGASAGLGLQYRINERFSVRLEADGFALGNPFDGDDSFVPATGLTFDEPDRVTMGRYTLGLTYSFPRRR